MPRPLASLVLAGVLLPLLAAQNGYEPLDPQYRNVRGVNYVPTYPPLDGTPGWYGVSSTTAMWAYFDDRTIPYVEQQLQWAKRSGFNTVRVFLSYLCWQYHDAKPDAVGENRFLAQWDKFLSLCEAEHLRVIPVVWDFVSLSQPYSEPDYDDPDRLHSPANLSFWHDSPGRSLAHSATDRPLAQQDLGRFVVECAHVLDRHDPEVLLAWDAANEPYIANDPDLGPRSYTFVQQTMALLKSARPHDKVLVSALVADRWPTTIRWAEDPNCDIVGIHVYGPNSPAVLRAMVHDATFVSDPNVPLGKPVLATEIGYPGGGFSYVDTVRYCRSVPRPDLPTRGANGVGFCTWMLMIGHADATPGACIKDNHPFKHGTGLFYGHTEGDKVFVRDLTSVHWFVNCAIEQGVDPHTLWFGGDDQWPTLVEMPPSHPFYVDMLAEGDVSYLCAQQWLQVLLMQASRDDYRQPGTTWDLYRDVAAMFRAMVHPYLDLKSVVSQHNGNPIQASAEACYQLSPATLAELQWFRDASVPGSPQFLRVIKGLEERYGLAPGELRPWDEHNRNRQRDLAILFGDFVHDFAQRLAPIMLPR